VNELIFPWPQKVLAAALTFRTIILFFIVTRQWADYRYFVKWYRPGMIPPDKILDWKTCIFTGVELVATAALLYFGGFFSRH
jgi:hypothetical protein